VVVYLLKSNGLFVNVAPSRKRPSQLEAPFK
jgi:hypothetical protein